MLGDWSTSLFIRLFGWLHRPPSTTCSGTGRPVCSFDYSVDCTDHRAWHARGLVDQSANLISRLIVLTTERDTLGEWPISTLVWKSGDCTKHVYVPNHARGLVDHALCRARGLCWLPIVLGDSLITPYAVLGTSFDHSSTTAWGLLFSITYELNWIILIF